LLYFPSRFLGNEHEPRGINVLLGALYGVLYHLFCGGYSDSQVGISSHNIYFLALYLILLLFLLLLIRILLLNKDGGLVFRKPCIHSEGTRYIDELVYSFNSFFYGLSLFQDFCHVIHELETVLWSCYLFSHSVNHFLGHYVV
jgi:hypothetical protein